MPLTHTRIALKAGPLVVLLQDRDAATDEQWAALMIDIKAARTSLTATNNQMFGLCISDGGAPNARQRSSLSAAVDGMPFRAGVLSDSTIVRGAVTAMAWFNQGIRSFSPSEANKLFDHLGLNQADIGLIRRAISDMYKLVRVTTLVSVPSLLPNA